MPNKQPLPVKRRAYALLHDPLINKNTAFSEEERRLLEIDGLLPARVSTIEEQAERVMDHLSRKADPLEKYIGLASVQDRNETLFYRVLMDNLEELMPIVYTPTVGQATREYSHVFRRGRGVWITPDHRGRIADVLRAASGGRDIRLLVVTDNEAILGLGDQGAGGISISVGKLSLYCAGAGIPPGETLPVSLDVGTNNGSLLDDPLYLGWPHRRLSGEAYDSLVEEFVEAVRTVFPGALLQWEDFRKSNALKLLDRYRDRLLSFNDDIQGTGAVALAGVAAAMRVTGGRLGEQRIVVHGAGAAGLGIARQLAAAIVADGGRPDAVGALDSRGLLVEDGEIRDDYKRELAWSAEVAEARGLPHDAPRDLLNVVEAWKPTVLIGTSGQSGAFDKRIVQAMDAGVDRPLILPFSNPTDYAEARPEEVIRWTEGRALVAAGSPFGDVEYQGRTIRVGQGNNVFIFPGLGLGSLLSGARRVSDGMINAASHALARSLRQEELDQGLLYPEVTRLREVCAEVAVAVMGAAADEGLATVDEGPDGATPDARSRRVQDAAWQPVYRDYVPA